MKQPTRRKTKGELEAEIKQALIQFEKEYMGRGPLEVHAFLIGDLVLVRLLGVLTTAEHKLIQSSAEKRSRYLVKQMRQELLEQGRPLLAKMVKDILKVDMKSLHTDISTRTGERIIVFTLESRPEYEEPASRRLSNGKLAR